YRIRQAREGKPHSGPLPESLLLRSRSPSDPVQQIYPDRLRQYSQIVEPDQRVNGFAPIEKQNNKLKEDLAQLAEIAERRELTSLSWRLLREYRGKPVAAAQALAGVLEQAPRAGEDFAVGLLDQALATFDDLAEKEDKENIEARVELLEKALFVAAHF